MPISYDKLWKLLIDKKMNRTDLKDASGISFNVLAKMGKNEAKYCVWKLPQDERYCYNCSLGNFGLDCRNNPIHYSDTEDDEE